MASPLEKKFDEYLKNIHSVLHEAMHHLDHVPFINKLLDKMDLITRNFVVLKSEKEDVFEYQHHLGRLTVHTGECLGWIEDYRQADPGRFKNMDQLRHHFFLLNDLFATSQNLIKSFYPII